MKLIFCFAFQTDQNIHFISARAATMHRKKVFQRKLRGPQLRFRKPLDETNIQEKIQSRQKEEKSATILAILWII